MKHLASLLLFGTLTFTGMHTVSAQAHGTGSMDGTVVSGRLDGARPTPAATPAGAAKAGEKKPLEGMLAKEEKSKSSTTVFAPGDKVFLVWKDDTGTKGDKVSVVWVAEETGGVFKKNRKLSEFAQTVPGPRTFGSFFLPPPSTGFPAGTYRADLCENGKVARSLKFTVKK